MSAQSDLVERWPEIRDLFSSSFLSSLHFAWATVNPDGTPHIAPFASLSLDRSNPRGTYFEIYSAQSRRNLDANPHFSVLAVNSDWLFWSRAMLRGRFSSMPAVRLSGTAHPRRLASDADRARWEKKVRLLKWAPGYRKLWAHLEHVRDVEFTAYEPVNLGAMSWR